MNYLPLYEGALLFKGRSNFSKTTKIHWNYLLKNLLISLYFGSAVRKKEKRGKIQKKQKKEILFGVNFFGVSVQQTDTNGMTLPHAIPKCE